MYKLVSIFISLIFSLFMYLGFIILLKKDKWRNYISDRWYYHPNAICVWRVIIGIAGTFLYFIASQHFLGILLFTISAVLDGVDGLVARQCNLITSFGEEIDPLCDKCTYLPPMFFFAYLGLLDMTALWILLIIELCGQFLIRYIIKQFTSFSVGANNFGKIKAVLCFALIIYCALLDGALEIPDFTTQLLHVCIILSVASSAFKIIGNRFYADILSVLNLSCGIIAIILFFQGHYVLGSIAILAGQIFDLFDGRMAEKHGGTRFGPWLDDIADLVSFGICPGLLIIVQGNLKPSAFIFGSLYSFCVGFRLWRYLAHDKQDNTLPTGVFNGLPSPAGAMVTLGACLYWQNAWISFSLILLTSYLLVSHIRFVHFGRVILKRIPRTIIVIFGFIIVFLIAYLIKARNPEMLGATLLILSLAYLSAGNRKIFKKIS